MKFSELSIDAMNFVVENYRDPQNPVIMNPDDYFYEFKANGELIPSPEIVDKFGHIVQFGDLVVFPYTNYRSFSVQEGRVLGVKFLKKDGQPRKEARVIVGWPKNEPKISLQHSGKEFGKSWSYEIDISRAPYDLIRVNDLI
jgi:hypothetical protein